jgi:molecular chaperone DnaK (HSP70)
MTAARFSIGIDLGTTNSALAYVPLSDDAGSQVLPIPQWETQETRVEAPTLPSFLYLPEDAVAAELRDRVPGTEGWIAGRLARRRAGETPGRVVRSAKSWLCHHTADRSAPILPWGSEDLPPKLKISPVQASALILNYLRGAWNSCFTQPDSRFDDQEITITVPASFDAAAQRLTLDAAQEAGFPAGVRLLEEPQAAFYCWLEQHSSAGPLAEHGAEPRHILIIDIGGGTLDFSLFEFRTNRSSLNRAITRVAVSDHILLGGDNVDLALANLLEPQLAGEHGRISGPQWDHLVASCRDLKETIFSGSASANDRLTVALAGRGSSLIAGAQTATVTRNEVERLVLDGFFPACDMRARPHRRQAALRDWGLPYAADSAVTHHLADFLRDRPRVDAVLFNGGSLHSPTLRQRLLDEITAWQDGARPLELENAEPDLAVARGAARFGKVLHAQSGRIAAGAARAVFLEAQMTPTSKKATVSPALICVLPRNAPADRVFQINVPGLEVRTDTLVSFQAHSSTRHGRCRAGDVLPWDPEAFHALPPLQTIIRMADGPHPRPSRNLPVRLAAKINALGLLQISCDSMDPAIQESWPLEFNLRPHEHGTVGASGQPASAPVEPNATTEAGRSARERLTTIFSRPPAKTDRLTANAVLRGLERIFGQPRHEWNVALLRSLWPALNDGMSGRKLSPEHEEAWLTLAGYLLRPGFGLAHDELRMDELWRLRDAGICFPGKRSKVQEYILWRRVAGGLTAERQETLLAGEIGSIRRGTASPELIRLAGSLERLPREAKAELIQIFIPEALRRAEDKQHCAPYLAALGLLLNRAPFHAGPESVVLPEFVASTYTVFKDLDWSDPELLELQNLFLRAARVVGDRNLDVPKSLRDQIAGKLERAGVAPIRIGPIRTFTPVGRTERAILYGEGLPPGLLLGLDEDLGQ